MAATCTGIDFRHVIWSLVRKPGGFVRYVYREEMFPSLVFREAYDAICAALPGTKGDLEYLRILHLVAGTMEANAAAALVRLQQVGTPITADAVKAIGPTTPASIAVLALAPPAVDLAEYDVMLEERAGMITMTIASLVLLLRAPTMARHADEVAQLAKREGWTFVRYLHHLVELEVHERRRRRIARNPKDSELPPDKTLATLHRTRLPAKVAKLLPALCEGEFSRARRQPARVRPPRARQDAPAMRHRPRADPARLPRAVHADLRARPAPARRQARPPPRAGARRPGPLRRRAPR